MPPAHAKNIVELRQLLAERFPGVRMAAGPPPTAGYCLSTGLPQMDHLLGGGLPKGAITEVIASGAGSGALLFLGALLKQAQKQGQWMGLVDGSDAFDPSAFDDTTLTRLLWVRCTGAKEAIKAADQLLHDGTVPLVVLDLVFCPPKELRKISSSTWFRFQRILASTALLAIVPEHLIGNAEARLTLARKFTIKSLEQPRAALLEQVEGYPTELALQPEVEPAAKIA